MRHLYHNLYVKFLRKIDILLGLLLPMTMFPKKKKIKNVRFYKNSIFNNVYFEGNNTLFQGARVFNSKIGYGTYLGKNVQINNVRVGKYCSIAENVKIGLGAHPVSYVSTHPSTYYSTKETLGFTYAESSLYNPYLWLDREEQILTSIGNDVWIGIDAIILDNITIGDGAIIAAGSVVTKNVEPYSIVGGVPARIIKYRFDSKIVDFLLRFQWWNKSADWIRKNCHLFSNPQKLYNEYSDCV